MLIVYPVITNVEVKVFFNTPTLRFTITPGTEHDSALNPGAVPSYCILPLFHAPAREGQVAFSSTNGMTPTESHIHVIHQDVGYVSRNGHAFPCQNPAQMQRAFHM